MVLKTPNARFWVYWNEPTKVTLNPGQVVNLYKGGRTEEGAAQEWLTLEHTGEGVRRTWMTDEVDCDGRFSRQGVDFCKLEELRSYWNEHADVFYPNWQEVARGQRDYAAEREGY